VNPIRIARGKGPAAGAALIGLLALGLPGGVGRLAPRPALAHATEQSEEQRISEVLQSALVAHGGEVHRCFERALADSLDVAGKLELAVDVGEAGRVVKAVSALDEVKSPVLLACLQETAQLWTLAGIEAGSTVILPLTFEGQMAQFSIKVADAPEHGPPSPAGKHKSATAAGGPPFTVKLLVDEATMRARQASLSLLSVSPANRIAMHRHPGAEMLYVLKGHARILGPPGTAPEKLDEGMAIAIPGGMPHAIENMGRQAPAVMLELFAPPGPEKVYRDPKDPAARAQFEVIHDLKQAVAPEGAHFTVAAAGKAEAIPVAGGKGKARLLLEPSTTGAESAYLGLLEAEPGTQIPRHSHPGSAEILYVVSGGGGELIVGSEKLAFGPEQAIQIPADQPHAVKFGGDEKTVMVQIYAPAGPEQRFRAGSAGDDKARAKGKAK
jgi:quercetin dioxygenase-like cupin family protein